MPIMDSEILAHNLHNLNEGVVDFFDQFSRFRKKYNVINKDLCLNLYRLVKEIDGCLNDNNLTDCDIEPKKVDYKKHGIRTKRRQQKALMSCDLCATQFGEDDLDEHINSDQHRIAFSKKNEKVPSEEDEDFSEESKSENQDDEDEDCVEESEEEFFDAEADANQVMYSSSPHLKTEYDELLKANSIIIKNVSTHIKCEVCEKFVTRKIRMKHLRRKEHLDSVLKWKINSTNKTPNFEEILATSKTDSKLFSLDVFRSVTRINYFCNLCLERVGHNEEMKKILDHISSKRHQEASSRNNGCISNENAGHKDKNTPPTFEEICKENFIKKIRQKSVCCRLCDSYMSMKSLKDHENGKSHTQKLHNAMANLSEFAAKDGKFENYEYSDYSYFCVACKLVFGMFEKHIIKHIHKPAHIKNVLQRKTRLNSKEMNLNSSRVSLNSSTASLNSSRISLNEETKSNVVSQSANSIKDEKLIKIIQNKDKLKCFLNNKIEISNKLMKIIEYKAIKTVLEFDLRKIYPDVKVYLFGPRLIGVGCYHRIQSIFVDTGLCYRRWPIDSKDYIQRKIKYIIGHLVLKGSWKSLSLASDFVPPVLFAKFVNHECDYMLTFSNGMDHSRTILLQYLFEKQPLCQILSIILMQITVDYKLDGLFNSYVICILVIFYLQLHRYLPSIKRLQKLSLADEKIGPWKTNFARSTDLIMKLPDENGIYEIIKDCLVFYSNVIDYNNELICPFLGERVQRDDFYKSLATILPELHNYYTGYVLQYKLNTNCPVCIQDMLELNYNLGENITTEALNKFVNCLKEVLQNIEW